LNLRPLPCQGNALPLSYAPSVLEYIFGAKPCVNTRFNSRALEHDKRFRRARVRHLTSRPQPRVARHGAAAVGASRSTVSCLARCLVSLRRSRSSETSPPHGKPIDHATCYPASLVRAPRLAPPTAWQRIYVCTPRGSERHTAAARCVTATIHQRNTPQVAQILPL
jgi:hypothetical protein